MPAARKKIETISKRIELAAAVLVVLSLVILNKFDVNKVMFVEESLIFLSILYISWKIYSKIAIQKIISDNAIQSELYCRAYAIGNYTPPSLIHRGPVIEPVEEEYMTLDKARDLLSLSKNDIITADSIRKKFRDQIKKIYPQLHIGTQEEKNSASNKYVLLIEARDYLNSVIGIEKPKMDFDTSDNQSQTTNNDYNKAADFKMRPYESIYTTRPIQNHSATRAKITRTLFQKTWLTTTPIVRLYAALFNVIPSNLLITSKDTPNAREQKTDATASGLPPTSQTATQ